MEYSEKEEQKNKEKQNNNDMNEKVHYEIKFVETDDGYRLEASGDKKALRRIGIGPNMVGRRRKSGHKGKGRGSRELRRARRRRAAIARRKHWMDPDAPVAPYRQARADAGHRGRQRRHADFGLGHSVEPTRPPQRWDEKHGDTWNW